MLKSKRIQLCPLNDYAHGTMKFSPMVSIVTESANIYTDKQQKKVAETSVLPVGGQDWELTCWQMTFFQWEFEVLGTMHGFRFLSLIFHLIFHVLTTAENKQKIIQISKNRLHFAHMSMVIHF